MNKSPKVSVIMPCYNHGEFLAEAVQSVTNLGRADFELIVVDDGSTDDLTRREIDKLCAPGTSVVRQENKGLGAARNAGVLASRGQYLLPLDADDRLRSSWMNRAVGMLDSDSKVGIVYGDAQCFGSQTERWRVGPFDGERLLYWNYIHASALYRRSVWEQNGGYDTTMPVQGLEDWDFWLGAYERGWKFVYLPEVFFDYRRTRHSMITRTAGFEDRVRDFIATKHALLYRQAWLSQVNDHKSIRWTIKNLRKLLKSRLKQRFSKGANAATGSEYAKS